VTSEHSGLLAELAAALDWLVFHRSIEAAARWRPGDTPAIPEEDLFREIGVSPSPPPLPARLDADVGAKVQHAQEHFGRRGGLRWLREMTAATYGQPTRGGPLGSARDLALLLDPEADAGDRRAAVARIVVHLLHTKDCPTQDARLLAEGLHLAAADAGDAQDVRFGRALYLRGASHEPAAVVPARELNSILLGLWLRRAIFKHVRAIQQGRWADQGDALEQPATTEYEETLHAPPAPTTPAVWDALVDELYAAAVSQADRDLIEARLAGTSEAEYAAAAGQAAGAIRQRWHRIMRRLPA
jgi:hypothetical protein